MWTLDAMQYETNLLHYFQNRIYRVYMSLYALQADTESLFEYMRAVSLSRIESYDYSPLYSEEHLT